MPRFAANLSFSPLEPMKPVSSSSGNSISSSSSAATINSSSSAGRQEAPGSRHHASHSQHHLAFGLDPLHPTTGPPLTASGALAGNVPAVQFDWNSSGLVNPLEGNCRFRFCFISVRSVLIIHYFGFLENGFLLLKSYITESTVGTLNPM